MALAYTALKLTTVASVNGQNLPAQVYDVVQTYISKNTSSKHKGTITLKFIDKPVNPLSLQILPKELERADLQMYRCFNKKTKKLLEALNAKCEHLTVIEALQAMYGLGQHTVNVKAFLQS